uniref:(California timema) hypothetical protein n=1 Tax=Timema californicum TaxID=61474 RepID=A0A7R9J5P5_TIMCA|nr:unnamed protein product [Timema californicum]
MASLVLTDISQLTSDSQHLAIGAFGHLENMQQNTSGDFSWRNKSVGLLLSSRSTKKLSHFRQGSSLTMTDYTMALSYKLHHIGTKQGSSLTMTDYTMALSYKLHHIGTKQVPDFVKNPPLVTGLEWEDPFHVNPLSVSEERRLQLLMTKIAALVNLRGLVLRPYFQDYELIAKNVGTATIGHFARVLSFLGILVSEEDFHLLLKKFLKDSYTVNYVAFIAAIDDIVKYLDHNLLLDLGGVRRLYIKYKHENLLQDILTQYPGRAISAELPKLPRPEIGHVRASDVFGLQSIFHPSLDRPVEQENLQEVIRRIQRHVFTNRIRVGQFFQDFDPMNCGRITVSQFRRGLDRVGINAIDRLYLSEPEIDMILQVYRDPNDSSRMCWKTFEDDIDQVANALVVLSSTAEDGEIEVRISVR